jgi:membrane protein YqaA with SNARE-associated domain
MTSPTADTAGTALSEIRPAATPRVRRWLAGYAAGFLAGLAALLVWIAADLPALREAMGSGEELTAAFARLDSGAKLLGFALYISLCCTFLPLPTGWIVSAVALQSVAVGPDLLTTTLLVASVGAAASTVANLNDYHLFTLMLRSRRIARLRGSGLYQRAARWFDRSPFFLVLLFNVLPIPVDVARMLAAAQKYPRLPFAAANFLGRFVRYAVIAAATYALAQRGWIAVLALLAAGAAMGLAKALKAWRSGRRIPDEPSAEENV